MPSIAQASLQLSGLFESELLVELMLRYWRHPHADNPAFRNELLEKATEILKLAVSGTSVLDGVSAPNMNFVAAIWCAECSEVAGLRPEDIELGQRQRWLTEIKQAIPSCFCNPDFLP